MAEFANGGYIPFDPDRKPWFEPGPCGYIIPARLVQSHAVALLASLNTEREEVV